MVGRSEYETLPMMDWSAGVYVWAVDESQPPILVFVLEIKKL